MIIFHEGLPGSGKSFEAMVKHIIPALQKGRHVFANLDGMNFERIAECCAMPLGAVKALLHVITEDQTREIYKHVGKDSFVVIDEAQDFFPTIRQPLDDAMTTFVTQHRHEGIDILLMGQDHRDVHTLWRRRIQNMVTFNKLDAVGMEKKYKATMHRYNGKKFVPISSTIETYDKKYFGTYKSHTDGTTNTANYKDKRAVIWNTPGIRYGLPIAFLACFWGISRLWAFFHPEKPPEAVTHAAPTKKQPTRQAQSAPVVAAPVAAAANTPQPVEPTDEETAYIVELQKQGRLRLAGTVLNQETGVLYGVIEVLDTSFHAKESLSFAQIEQLGWSVSPAAYGVKLQRNDKAIIVTSWPVDPFGRVSDATKRDTAITGT